MTLPSLGLILTSARTLDAVRRYVAAGRLDVLKVIAGTATAPGWGLAEGWTNATRHAAARIASQLVVRTVHGDLSAHNGAHEYLHPEHVEAEVDPWWQARDPARPFLIELGNEPLLHPEPDDQRAHVYAHYLRLSIEACRRRYPGARIIGPAHMLNHSVRVGDEEWGQKTWIKVLAPVLRQCDYLGIHAYHIEQFVRGLTWLREYVGAHPVYLTEFALNQTLNDSTRGQIYAATLRQFKVAGACLYHLDEVGGTDPVHFNPRYRLSLATLAAFAVAWSVPTIPAPPKPVPPPGAPPRPPVTSVPMTREHLTRGRPKGGVKALVLHSTAGRDSFDWLRNGGNIKIRVSCHYLINKAGKVSQFVADHDTAWHAGHSQWRGLEVWSTLQNGTKVPSLNPRSIGIELENLNTGKDPYPEAQYQAAVALARYLVHLHGIERENLVRHLDISPGRKTDPAGFDWQRFVADVYRNPL